MALAIKPLMDRPAFEVELLKQRRRGDLIILDNGAAEGLRSRDDVLVSYSWTIKADEICLPDVLGDSQATIDAVNAFVIGVGASIKPTTRMMAIVQGQNHDEMARAVDEYSEMYQIRSIGIPRDSIKRTGKVNFRIDFANWIETEYPGRFRIHLLGTSPLWVKEICYVAKYAPCVASVDTSLPFNAALANADLVKVAKAQSAGLKPDVSRPADYFTTTGRQVNTLLIQHNINTLRGWAVGTSPSPSQL